MSNYNKHHRENLDIKDVIKLLKSQNNQIEKSFEDIEKLIERNEKLSEQLLGIKSKRGKY